MKKPDTKTCHACQAELQLDEKRCPYCGQRQQTLFELRLNDWFRTLFPKCNPSSFVLMIAMIIYFIVIAIDVLSEGFGISEAFLSPPAHIAYQWGAHRQGEFVWWRLITANFIHFGIVHLVFNVIALRYVVPYIERTFGSSLTFASFILLGSASMAFSNIYAESAAISAGASGALMGFIGLAAVAAHREHTALSIEVRNSMIRWAVMTMGFGFICNSSGAMGIDNIAHASGLVLGGIAGFILPVQSTTGFTKLWMIRLARVLALTTFAVTVAAFAINAASYASLNYQQECEVSIHIKNFRQAETACEKAYRHDKSRVVSYRNYIVISIIRGKNDRAAALCIEGHKRFAGKERTEFDELCKSVGVMK